MASPFDPRFDFDDEPDEVGALRSRRGQRAHPPETDPRFLRPGRTGREQRLTSLGRLARLLGSNPDQKVRMIDLASPQAQSWLIACSTSNPAVNNGVWARGLGGTGGATVPVLFDVKPDTNIQVPGSAVTLDAEWAPTYAGTGPGTMLARATVNPALLATFVDVSTVASYGGTSRGNASLTQRFLNPFIGTYGFEFPPFADEFMVYAPSFTNLVQLDIATAADPALGNVIITYTAAQLQAMLAAGQTIKLPGLAAGYWLTTSGAPFSSYNVSFLSL